MVFLVTFVVRSVWKRRRKMDDRYRFASWVAFVVFASVVVTFCSYLFGMWLSGQW
jgi:hypothetical protein